MREDKADGKNQEFLSSRTTNMVPAGVKNVYNPDENTMTENTPDKSFDDGHEKKYGYAVKINRQQEMLKSISAANLTKTSMDIRMRKSGSTE
jgi:hypothetical protein